ncbi:helix-turn-helix domain-containing protein [Caloramator proteoclasticus]|uniref:DNA-binding transcriptional regulator, XRE-family HTH domain n=1 Tax=Caloramator proteoclasticus DSM 10124 TaxID=1121262 RepID=A0A1M5C8L5_9CLOT|nr:helix-turn-helix transcriptional regulator [Caloramator proteoclasticus]SHF50996.1 DNA-binding transcriptional regulator, XRE-family HTH domain [Caloramator proteoclasticus DSM 10124]
MHIGDRIKKLRTEKQITQPELAKILGVSRSTIAMYENNEREPNIKTINKIADFFNVTTDYLLGRTDNPTGMILTNKELNNYLPEEAKQRKIEVEIEKKPNLTEEELKYIADMVLKKLAEHYANVEKNK